LFHFPENFAWAHENCSFRFMEMPGGNLTDSHWAKAAMMSLIQMAVKKYVAVPLGVKYDSLGDQ
jgi:4-hydroxy-3-methylbut-2-en-1-yl diphosphate synthase IspG/GcpE